MFVLFAIERTFVDRVFDLAFGQQMIAVVDVVVAVAASNRTCLEACKDVDLATQVDSLHRAITFVDVAKR